MPARLELAEAMVERIVALSQQATAFSENVTNRIILAGNIPTVTPGEPPGGAKLLTIAGWVGWAVFLACVVGVFIICIKMGINAHKNRGGGDGGGEEAGKLFWPLLGCIIGSGAGAILGAVA
ncbi:hypothetical protein SAMN05892883_2246 [Jatrophihabitans sp. GAS493]|uniref:hypothetical protein n=1 Tax=Jatrophihabitans sp. GAS493 TaxID=1907575 RepID=UPI000BB9A531|nr:hypothetical protein [Jatrophihabitans sp. GAS493]SOD72933.1 hypothetical protein SAMN05892883_2246 [Jatrophihabitans sp. GAS493]